VALGGQTLKTDAYAWRPWLGDWLVVPEPSLDDLAQTEVSAYPARSTQAHQEVVIGLRTTAQLGSACGLRLGATHALERRCDRHNSQSLRLGLVVSIPFAGASI
jgi:hypothetical protein